MCARHARHDDERGARSTASTRSASSGRSARTPKTSGASGSGARSAGAGSDPQGSAAKVAKGSGGKGSGAKNSGTKGSGAKGSKGSAGTTTRAPRAKASSGRTRATRASKSTRATGTAVTRQSSSTAVAGPGASTTATTTPPVHSRGVARSGSRTTVSLDERRKERLGAIRRLGRRRLLIALGVLVLVAAAVWAVAFSPLTGLDTVTVTTESESEYVDVAEVEAAADAQLGTPLVRLDVAAIEAAAEELPGVADATVERTWPSGVDIAVTPRVPVANAQAGERWQLLDTTGATIAEVDEPVAQLPQVDVPEGEGSERVLDAILSAIGQMPPELSSQVTSAAAESPGAITFMLADGAAVLWGSAEESDLKSQVLLVLLEQAPASSYDVSVPRSPTTG